MGIYSWELDQHVCIPPVPSPQHSAIAGGAAWPQSKGGISTAFDDVDQLSATVAPTSARSAPQTSMSKAPCDDHGVARRPRGPSAGT